MDFLVVIMASGIARECVRTTTTTTAEAATESLNMDIHVMLNWHLSIQGICWPVSRGHIAGSSWELIEVKCFWKLTADQVLVFLTCFKQGQVVYNASSGLKVNRIIP